ncbi:MAG: MlaC/ttg2D family ABC transporter substrate-binding protein [Candidatus Binataceae bacterium]
MPAGIVRYHALQQDRVIKFNMAPIITGEKAYPRPTDTALRLSACSGMIRLGHYTAIGLLALVITMAAAAVRANALTVSIQPGAFKKPNDPVHQITTAINQVTAVFDDHDMPITARRRKLRQLAAQHFDFEQMSRSALGYHWKQLTPQQRAAFVPLFTDFIEDIYLSKLQQSNVQKVQNAISSVDIKFTKEITLQPGYVKVYSVVILHNDPNPMNVNYLLKREKDGWRVYDLELDSISVIANYRNQFDRVINMEGYPKLVAELQAKQQKLASTLGE